MKAGACAGRRGGPRRRLFPAVRSAGRTRLATSPAFSGRPIGRPDDPDPVTHPGSTKSSGPYSDVAASHVLNKTKLLTPQPRVTARSHGPMLSRPIRTQRSTLAIRAKRPKTLLAPIRAAHPSRTGYTTRMPPYK
ncbi:hypothetical protein HU200_034898 [Digitaria exilis]|uniref:Uncharacterized protein n=1 Tax=Digitaria exilis TaxID=1010633 RepID=A0A835BSN7_9POAL|nr:hypothetical protein HU200_034898 [Digitaria exilis]CAB3495721.1 unnamed protein product [Digitaria exilis]